MAMTKEEQKAPVTDEDREILSYKPTPKQWSEAYAKIQASKEAQKKRDAESAGK